MYTKGEIRHGRALASYCVHSDGNTELPSKVHGGFEIAFPISGIRPPRMKLRGREYTPQAGEFMIYNGLEDHLELFEPNYLKQVRGFIVDPEFIEGLLEGTEIGGSEIVFDSVIGPVTPELGVLFQEIFEARDCPDALPMTVECASAEMIFRILGHQRHSFSDRLKRLGGAGYYPSQINRAKAIMSRHLANPEFTIQSLSREVGMSLFHFTRCFKAKEGFSPLQYLIWLRVERAKAELRKTAASVSDVAFRSGFGDLSCFNKVFKSKVGITPTSFRLGKS